MKSSSLARLVSSSTALNTYPISSRMESTPLPFIFFTTCLEYWFAASITSLNTYRKGLNAACSTCGRTVSVFRFMTALKTLLNASDASVSLLKTASSYLIQQRSYDETTNAKLLTASLLDLLIWLEDNPKFRRLILLSWFKLLTALKDWNKDR